MLNIQGDYAGAAALYRRALEASERVLGPEHPDTLNSVNNLAVLLMSQGDYAGAAPLYRRALEARERVLGPEHPDTLTSVNNLAHLLNIQGDYAGAEPLYRRALEGLLKISVKIERTHPNLQACIFNYARCLKELGRRPEEIWGTLEAMMRPFGMSLGRGGGRGGAGPSRELREVLEQVRHAPSKLQEIAEQLRREAPLLYLELMQWIRSQQEAGALPGSRQRLDALRQQTLEKEQILGPNHPDTVAALNALARHLESMNAFDEAEAEYRKAQQRAPDDILVLGNYAFFLQNVRQDFRGARDRYLRALQAHPADAINHTNYAGLCLVSGATGESEEHLREAWRLVAGKADGYVTRTLFLRAALATSRGEDPSLYLGQLKTLFDQGIRPVLSRNTSIREYLRRKVHAEQAALMGVVYAAVYEPDGLARLSAMPTWQAIQSRPLGEPWP